MAKPSFDFRALNKFTSPQAADDLNRFLEQMPKTAGKTVLIAAGIAWGAAAALGLFAAVQMKSMTELRAKLQETTALKPAVPIIKNVPVSQDEVKKFAEVLKVTYRGVTVKEQGNSIQITADTTARFAEFREAVGHVQNGGTGWWVTLDNLCVGRECKQKKLGALLKINKVTVEKPQEES